MDQHLLLIADFDDDDDDDESGPWEVHGQGCPACGGHHFWIEDFKSYSQATILTVYTCTDCGYVEEVYRD